MKLSRTVAYAIQAALLLADAPAGEPVPCSYLASHGKMPQRFLLQILRDLVTHGILQSTRGVEGGYKLGRPAGEITLLEMIEAVDGPISARLTTFNQLSDHALSRLQKAMDSLTTSTRRELESVTLADLLTNHRA
ncbi:MAG: Rrf2 family transcriptional regulator [Pirellulales bacterium]|nr:Rrf2 family transcriptional regulator [Pirellulales bacterium]